LRINGSSDRGEENIMDIRWLENRGIGLSYATESR
jgi:hypothetical protein